MTYDGTMTALEDRADVASLEALHTERRALLKEYSELRALHGPGGKWDNKRKALLETMKIRARMELTKDGAKTTEAAIDAYGHGDAQYIEFIDRGILDATRLCELEIVVSEIEERIRNREIALSVYGKEVSLH